MKIFTNVTREYQGGITTTNNSLLSFLAGSGYEVIGVEFDTVRCRKGPISIPELDQGLFKHYYLTMIDLPLEKIINAARNLGDLKRYFSPVIMEIKGLMLVEKPDVVLINGTSYFPWLISIAASECGIPTVVRYHGISTKETAHLPAGISSLFTRMEKTFFKKENIYIFPSLLCHNTVEKEVFGRKIENVHIIPNPVHSGGKRIKKSSGRNIAAVSRDSWIKNLDAFFDLHKILCRQGWEHSASLISELKDPSRAPKKVKCLQPLKYDELLEFYASQDLLIVPSRFETFGNVPMEAVCSGTPVMVSKNMGCAEILIGAGLDHMVVDYSDIKNAADRAKELCGLKIPEAQLEKIRKMLLPEKINSKIVSILRKAAAREAEAETDKI